MSLASLTRGKYCHASMFSDNARDSLIFNGRILGLLLVVVVVIEATAP